MVNLHSSYQTTTECLVTLRQENYTNEERHEVKYIKENHVEVQLTRKEKVTDEIQTELS